MRSISLILLVSCSLWSCAKRTAPVLPDKCLVATATDGELIECLHGAGLAWELRDAAIESSGLELAVLSQLSAYGYPQDRGQEVLSAGEGSTSAHRTDFVDRKGAVTARVWARPLEVEPRRFAFCVIKRPLDEAQERKDCAQLMTALASIRAASGDALVRELPPAPKVHGRSLAVPVGCRTRDGNSILCGPTTLTVEKDARTAEEATDATARDLREKGGVVTTTLKPCAVDGMDGTCGVLVLEVGQGEEPVSVIFGSRAGFGFDPRLGIRCMTPGNAASSAVPMPCDQILRFRD